MALVCCVCFCFFSIWYHHRARGANVRKSKRQQRTNARIFFAAAATAAAGNNTIHYVQVPKDMDEEQLRPLFEQAGPIAHIMVIRDRQTDAHRGEFLFYTEGDIDTTDILRMLDRPILSAYLYHTHIICIYHIRMISYIPTIQNLRTYA